MTCKDCVHYEVCEDAREFDNYEVYDIICDHAKNKSDFVEVKHGEWTLHPDGSGTCSNCNRTQKSVWDMDKWQKFCGHCGADMRKEGADNV